MPCSPPSRRHRAEPPDDAAGLTRRDFMVGLVAASLAVGATLGILAFIRAELAGAGLRLLDLLKGLRDD